MARGRNVESLVIHLMAPEQCLMRAKDELIILLGRTHLKLSGFGSDNKGTEAEAATALSHVRQILEAHPEILEALEGQVRAMHASLSKNPSSQAPSRQYLTHRKALADALNSAMPATGRNLLETSVVAPLSEEIFQWLSGQYLVTGLA